ncbi:ATP-grasp domain-containing protein [Agarivorans sp. QJM3NY_25]|uniref:ATP-grasp domain-containing protein n=1 Tax=Agarivorans sp. QJM3NY_25 TaxID=3421430 RepID=UPI003D7F12F7
MSNSRLPKLGLLYLDHVLRFFDKSNFKGWPNTIETVVYHWGHDKNRFIEEVKQKKIEVLIGNIPATAYETFRQIARELPEVRFIPSLDTQFSNKSKENVTHFCEKYQIPIPPTDIFYEYAEAEAFLKTTTYPKIIKKSYGPSNYGGYFVHKVDNFQEAKALLAEKKYYPVYLQNFVPMSADIRVMLIGHKPVCAFWRRPPEGDWLTNTSQGGSMDYQDVPKEVLDLAVQVSKAAKAEYWACDIAVGIDGKLRILECATAFAAFPYIRDWIGQYLMWNLSDGQFKLPNIPLYNWEELGKMSASILRTMRYITFGRKYFPSCDSGETFTALSEDNYPIVSTNPIPGAEEWPSEVWNRQDNYPRNQSSTSPRQATMQSAGTQSQGDIPSSEEADESSPQQQPD